MTPLRERYIEDMQLRGLSETTQQVYVNAVRQLAAYYNKSPDKLSDEELRPYFLYLKNEKQVASGTYKVAISSLKFLYEHTLKRSWPTLELIRAPQEKKLPVVLSRAEVHQVLSCLKKEHQRACLSTIYSCRLRTAEGVRLRVGDIDSAQMLLHVRQGKGHKDRYVPLPTQTLELLRAKFRDALKKTDLFDQVSPEAWTKDWVVHSQPVGRGHQALTYLSRYVLRVAICNKHILKLENDQVTFRYRETNSGETKYCTLPTLTFMHRFLQHVLPKGFVKIRYYGFLAPGKRPLLNQLRLLLGTLGSLTLADPQPTPASLKEAIRCCSTCGKAMRLIETLLPNTRSPP